MIVYGRISKKMDIEINCLECEEVIVHTPILPTICCSFMFAFNVNLSI